MLTDYTIEKVRRNTTAREMGVNLACEATNEKRAGIYRRYKLSPDVGHPAAIDRVAREQRGGREREKTRVLVLGLYRSLEWKAKPEARFN